MWTLIILIGFLPVSGALWAEKYVKGVVGRAITIDCHYEAKYHSHTKYWCHGWTRECSVIVETNGQHGRRGRVSITDKSVQGIFSVTMEDLRSGDTGWYSCGITTPVIDPMFNVRLQVSNEPVSVPVLRYLSPANVSRLRASVLVSCESLQGSLPIQYTWHVKNSTVDPKISVTNELVLPCQPSHLRAHQYYCRASNSLGKKSSGMVDVTIFNNGEFCHYEPKINGTEPPSVPLLRFSPPTNGSSCGDSVSVSCESVNGSLPIQYSWYEKTPSGDSKISGTDKLDLHCHSLKYKNHLYYCKASNAIGENSSEVVNVSISNSVRTCRYVIEVNGMGPIYICENTVTEKTTTTGSKDSTPNKMPIYIIVLRVIGSLLILLVICLLCCLRKKNREWKHDTRHGGGNNETQEENIAYADIHNVRNNEAAAQSANNENETVYANMKFKRKSRAGRSVMDEDNPTYADIKFQSQTTRPKQKPFSLGTPQDSE